jgi:NADPH:quinone reductase
MKVQFLTGERVMGQRPRISPAGEDLATLANLVATGRLHAEIGEIADWTEPPRVLASVRDRRVRGNAVLTLPQAV